MSSRPRESDAQKDDEEAGDGSEGYDERGHLLWYTPKESWLTADAERFVERRVIRRHGYLGPPAHWRETFLSELRLIWRLRGLYGGSGCAPRSDSAPHARSP
jgi:hypothetical protein